MLGQRTRKCQVGRPKPYKWDKNNPWSRPYLLGGIKCAHYLWGYGIVWQFIVHYLYTIHMFSVVWVVKQICPVTMISHVMPSWNLACTIMSTRRYGPLRGPTSSSCGGLRPRLFCPLGKERAFYAVLAHFWRFLVSSSSRGNI